MKVYVDEPDLGAMKGMPVTITWDACLAGSGKAPSRRTPTEIVAMGARQVGEGCATSPTRTWICCRVTNVNAVILSETVRTRLQFPRKLCIASRARLACMCSRATT